MPKFDNQPCGVEVPVMHAKQFGRVFLFARRSSDGLWERNGVKLPFLWWCSGVGGCTGITVKLGPWMSALAIVDAPRK